MQVLEGYCRAPDTANDPDILHQQVARLHNRVRKARRAGAQEAPVCKRCGAELRQPGQKLGARCQAQERAQRERRESLSGRVALVTGGRIKIGRATALRLLRCGAKVTVLTRFSSAAALSFSREPDFEDFQARLEVLSVDLRQPARVLEFAEHLVERRTHLDIVVHNAAQTNRRSAQAYLRHLALQGASPDVLGPAVQAVLGPAFGRLLELEQGQLAGGPPLLQAGEAPELPPEPEPDGAVRSWMMEVDQVPPTELLEVLLVNAAAPFLLNRALRPLFDRSPFGDRYIVHVVGADGAFGAKGKSSRHAHINMSKAALNMLTRTSASYYARAGILMNSVDTGWVSEERPDASSSALQPDRTEEEAAARICHPIFEGVCGRPYWGRLMRDYQPSGW